MDEDFYKLFMETLETLTNIQLVDLHAETVKRMAMRGLMSASATVTSSAAPRPVTVSPFVAPPPPTLHPSATAEQPAPPAADRQQQQEAWKELNVGELVEILPPMAPRYFVGVLGSLHSNGAGSGATVGMTWKRGYAVLCVNVSIARAIVVKGTVLYPAGHVIAVPITQIKRRAPGPLKGTVGTAV